MGVGLLAEPPRGYYYRLPVYILSSVLTSAYVAISEFVELLVSRPRSEETRKPLAEACRSVMAFGFMLAYYKSVYEEPGTY
jgi:hypothetical protein